jgi:hypothetical protein
VSLSFDWFGAHDAVGFALITLIPLLLFAAFGVLIRALYLAEKFGPTLEPGDPDFANESDVLAPPDLSR